VTTRDPRQAFVPGQWLGPVAGGTAERASGVVGSLAVNKAFGERAAKVYPWMSCVSVNMPSLATSPILRVTRTNAGNLGEPSFYNDTNRIIKINEIRFVAMPPAASMDLVNAGAVYDFDLARRFGVTIKHTDYDIVRDFLPLYALATYNNAASPILDGSMAFSLPTLYTIPGSHPFQIRMNAATKFNSPVPARSGISIGLCGKDEHNHPYVSARDDILSGLTLVAFNENTGGGPLKDLIMEYINFNLAEMLVQSGVPYLAGLETLIQFIPPEGPRWHSPTDWFPINGIINQGVSFIVTDATTGTALQNQDWVCYRPVTPHIVTPRQSITIDLKCYQNASWTSAVPVQTFNTPIWVIMLGTQESLAI
jgi:hypothetical protein